MQGPVVPLVCGLLLWAWLMAGLWAASLHMDAFPVQENAGEGIEARIILLLLGPIGLLIMKCVGGES